MINKAELSAICSTALLLLSTGFGFAAPEPIPEAISKYYSLGDSFASGIAAGKAFEGGGTGNENRSCNRFEGAYSVQLHNDKVKATSFKFLSCSGSKTEHVQNLQVPYIDKDANLVTVTAGGTDVRWGSVINGCVYKFEGDKSPDCNTALTEVETLINSNLYDPVFNMIYAILDGAQNAKVYITGYVQFWNAETTLCDGVSWNFYDANGSKMTRDIRLKMNQLTLSANRIIKSVVDAYSVSHPNRVIFVDYDPAFQGNRFCEEGVQEPQKKDEIRPEALLFQINTKSESEEVALDPSYPADEFFDAIKRGEAAGLKVNPIYGDASALLNPIAPKIPFFSAKIFHPTTKGHAKIVGAFPAQL
ncbi:MAG: hypothetical protein M1813_002039 [Trichoglossum hirsutum]|nr:MAG: hypothetical protein M1813_002039 [Trichoglossum hirsutum]